MLQLQCIILLIATAQSCIHSWSIWSFWWRHFQSLSGDTELAISPPLSDVMWCLVSLNLVQPAIHPATFCPALVAAADPENQCQPNLSSPFWPAVLVEHFSLFAITGLWPHFLWLFLCSFCLSNSRSCYSFSHALGHGIIYSGCQTLFKIWCMYCMVTIKLGLFI